MSNHYVCGNYEQLAEPLSRKWSKTDLSWYYAGGHPFVADADARAAFGKAFAAWADVTGLTFRPANSASSADIVMAVGRIDGPGGVLAWSEFPAGTRAVNQRYDSGDKYVVDVGPAWPKVGLIEVGVHEIGHALGLDHDAANADAIMRPTYEPGLYKPTARDVQRIQALYGPPRAPQPPQPPPEEGRVLKVLTTYDQYGDVMASYEVGRRLA